MKKTVRILLFLIAGLLLTTGRLGRLLAAPSEKVCGNGVCQPSLSETCLTCPADCGACATPTPPPATPTLPPITPPPVTPTPAGTNPPNPTDAPSATGTPPSTSESTGSTASETPTFTPVLTLSSPGNYVSSPTLAISGYAQIEAGNITRAEYSTDNLTWQTVPPSDGSYDSNQETFAFVTSSLADGRYSLVVRAVSNTGSMGSATLDFTVISQPPVITVTSDFSQPTDDLTPTVTGNISSPALATAKISLNNQETWFNLSVVNGRFSFTPANPLEDGNYQVVITATDLAGNLTLIEGGTIIVDTIPPLIGGSEIYIGSQRLDQSGRRFITATGVKHHLVVSIKGGATSALILADGQEISMQKIYQTSLWQGELTFSSYGSKEIRLQTQDGAGNREERAIAYFTVNSGGSVYLAENQEPASDTSVVVYVYVSGGNNWQVWQAAPFGQTNPQITDSQGRFAFILPQGRYYLEARKGNRITQSEIFTLTQSTVINPQLPLVKHFFWQTPYSVPLQLPADDSPGDLPLDFIGQPITAYFPEIGRLTEVPRELLFLASWSQASGDQVKLLGQPSPATRIVFSQENEFQAATFLRRGNYQIHYLTDPLGTATQNLGLTQLPTHIILNPKGEIVDYHAGVLTWEEMLVLQGELP